MLAEHIGGIALAGNVKEAENLCRNGLTNAVVRKCVVTLVESRVRNGCTRDNGLVVPKKTGVFHDWNSQAAQSGAKVNDLVSGLSGSNKFRAVGCCLNGGLALGEPINWRLVDEVQDTGCGAPSDEIMAEICIHAGCGDNRLAKWLRRIWWQQLLHIPTN
jgi:hypothetical protein